VGALKLGRRVTVALVGLATVGAGCSTPQGLTTPPLPSGWTTVTYHGVGVDVPSNWTVEPWHQNCGVDVPTVFLGPEQPSVLSCPAFDPGGAEVVLGSLPFSGGTTSAATQTINGLHARVVSQQTDAPCGRHSALFSNAWVTLPAKGFTISISVSDSRSALGAIRRPPPRSRGRSTPCDARRLFCTCSRCGGVARWLKGSTVVG